MSATNRRSIVRLGLRFAVASCKESKRHAPQTLGAAPWKYETFSIRLDEGVHVAVRLDLDRQHVERAGRGGHDGGPAELLVETAGEAVVDGAGADAPRGRPRHVRVDVVTEEHRGHLAGGLVVVGAEVHVERAEWVRAGHVDADVKM